MADNESELPEGTDQVIDGAMNRETTAGQTTAGTPTPRRGGGARRAGSGGSASGGNALMEKVRSETGKISEQAAGKARGFVGQGIERSAEAIGNVAKLVGDTASGLDERLGQEYGDYARRAADTLEGTANKLASKDPDELIDDTREFIRKSPGVALAGAAIVGFALARLVKSGLSPRDDDDDNGGDKRKRSQRSRG